MKAKSVTLSVLLKNNKRLCISAKRALGRCFECSNYTHCESRIINPQYDKLQTKKAKLYRTIKNINKKIKEV